MIKMGEIEKYKRFVSFDLTDLKTYHILAEPNISLLFSFTVIISEASTQSWFRLAAAIAMSISFRSTFSIE
jgi:hypothetical protein